MLMDTLEKHITQWSYTVANSGRNEQLSGVSVGAPVLHCWGRELNSNSTSADYAPKKY